MENLVFGLTYVIPASFAAIAIAVISNAALNAVVRNPAKANAIRTVI